MAEKRIVVGKTQIGTRLLCNRKGGHTLPCSNLEQAFLYVNTFPPALFDLVINDEKTNMRIPGITFIRENAKGFTSDTPCWIRFKSGDQQCETNRFTIVKTGGAPMVRPRGRAVPAVPTVRDNAVADPILTGVDEEGVLYPDVPVSHPVEEVCAGLKKSLQEVLTKTACGACGQCCGATCDVYHPSSYIDDAFLTTDAFLPECFPDVHTAIPPIVWVTFTLRDMARSFKIWTAGMTDVADLKMGIMDVCTFTPNPFFELLFKERVLDDKHPLQQALIGYVFENRDELHVKYPG